MSEEKHKIEELDNKNRNTLSIFQWFMLIIVILVAVAVVLAILDPILGDFYLELGRAL